MKNIKISALFVLFIALLIFSPSAYAIDDPQSQTITTTTSSSSVTQTKTYSVETTMSIALSSETTAVPDISPSTGIDIMDWLRIFVELLSGLPGIKVILKLWEKWKHRKNETPVVVMPKPSSV